MYNQNNPVVIGNPALQPESVKTTEASFGMQFTQRTHGRLTYFRNDVTNMVVLLPTPAGKALYANAGHVISDGVELEVKANFAEGSYIGMNYTFQHPLNTTTGNVLPDVPSQRGNIMANWSINSKLNLYGALLLKGSTPRATGDPRANVPAYGIVNTTFTARDVFDMQQLDFRLSVSNLFNKKYADPSPPPPTLLEDYPKPGRSFFGELRYTFN